MIWVDSFSQKQIQVKTEIRIDLLNSFVNNNHMCWLWNRSFFFDDQDD